MANPSNNLSQTSMLSRHGLPVAEWMAENAFIPPGMHRLLAAGGLAGGLWSGRAFMDVLTARHHSDNSEMKRGEVPEMVRPFYGMMSYNPYSDAASDRWKAVVDRFAPAMFGGFTAYLGGSHYFNGRSLSGKPLHPLSDANRTILEKALDPKIKGPMPLSAAQHLGALAQAKTQRAIAAVTYWFGATAGTDKAGGFVPFNHNTWAVSFADGAGIRPFFPENIPLIGGMSRWINRTFIHNYSTGSLALGRAMGAQAKWIEGNLHTQGDPAHWLDEKRLTRWARDSLQNFPKATEEEISRVASTMRGVINDAWHTMRPLRDAGKLSTEDMNRVYGILQGGPGKAGFSAVGIDHLLHDSGIHLGKAEITNHGFTTWTSRFFGSNKGEAIVREAYDQSLLQRFGIRFEGKINPALSSSQKLFYGTSLAVGVGALLAAGATIANHITKRAERLDDGKGNSSIVTSHYKPTAEQNKAFQKKGNILDWVNGTPLNIAEWGSRMVIVPPSMHRLMGAAYLSGALYLGMKVADAMTGRKLPLLRSGSLANSLLEKKDITGIWTPLRSLHGMLEYTPGSSLITDRWRQAAHYLIPVTFGAAGNYVGSALYFRDRALKMETPHGLEDYTDKILMEQSKPFAGITALTSIFNTGSGIHLIPFLNYSSNLQTRYTMGAGLQVATPGLGKWWSGNAGMSPWGVKKTLAHVINYLSNNPEQRPEELPSLVHSVLGKLYPKMPEQELLLKKRNFLHAIHSVRDAYFADGAVPASKLPELKTAMKTLLTGDGLEQVMLLSGFNPAEANLASNGASGAIANFFGKSGKVHRLEAEYRSKFTERLAHYKAKTAADIIMEHKSPAANENTPVAANDDTPLPKPKQAASSHVERLNADKSSAEPALGA